MGSHFEFSVLWKMLKVYNLMALIGFGIGMVELCKNSHKILYRLCLKTSKGQLPTSLDYDPKSPNAGAMIGQRRRRWSSIETTLGQCIVQTGYNICTNWCYRSKVPLFLLLCVIHCALNQDVWLCTCIQWNLLSRHEASRRCWFNAGPLSQTLFHQ